MDGCMAKLVFRLSPIGCSTHGLGLDKDWEKDLEKDGCMATLVFRLSPIGCSTHGIASFSTPYHVSSPYGHSRGSLTSGRISTNHKDTTGRLSWPELFLWHWRADFAQS